jgi:ABC-type multidrug transport system fused ATPase/permease subunit
MNHGGTESTEDNRTLRSLWFNWNMNFDPQIALHYAAAISRPRRVGTVTHEEVAAEIAERLRGWGYAVEQQPFTFYTASEIFLKLFLLISVFLIAMLLLWQVRVIAVLLVLLIALFMPLNHRVQSAALQRDGRGLQLGQRFTSANLIARLSLRGAHSEQSTAESKNRDETVPDVPHLYLVAHYDSKSQHMPLAVRIVLFMLAISAGLILVVLTLLDVSSAFYIPIGLLALASAVPLLFLDVGNDSPGAIDNASSVGLVLHLAEVLARRTDWQDKLHLTILIPSAEEMTLMGSVAYVAAHEEVLREQGRSGGVYILNFDGIGIDGDLYYVGHSRQSYSSDRISLLTRVQNACAELDLPLKRFGFIGALFDHIPFAQRGFDAISLITVGKASRSVHTPADAIDKLHVRGFDQAGRVALRVIDHMIRGKT